MKSSSVKHGTNVTIATLCAFAILIMVNYLSMRHFKRLDWTSTGQYSLSDKTKKTVAGLKNPVEIYTLWSQGDPKFRQIQELLLSYEGIGGANIKLEMIDPDQAPERTQLLISQYGAKVRTDISGQVVDIDAGIFVVTGDKVKYLSQLEFESFKEDFSMEEDHGENESISKSNGEQIITSAIIQVTRREKIKICFSTGHGEMPLTGMDRRSLSHVSESLKGDAYAVESVVIAQGVDIPTTCNAVVVAGPARKFNEDESQVFKKYLAQGGSLLLLLEPSFEMNRFKPNGLEKFCLENGIRLNPDFILETDERRLVVDSVSVFKITEFANHPATRFLQIPDSMGADVRSHYAAYDVVLSTARSLSQVDTDRAMTDVLAKTSMMSWGETDLATLGNGIAVPQKTADDNKGPLNVAIKSTMTSNETGDKSGKLIVVGDADFLLGDLFFSYYNRDFFSGLLGWLTAQNELIAIAPKKLEHVKLNLDTDGFWFMVFVVVGQWMVVIVTGIFVWLRRRS